MGIEQSVAVHSPMHGSAIAEYHGIIDDGLMMADVRRSFGQRHSFGRLFYTG